MDLDATKGKPAPRFKPTPLSPTGYKNPRDKSNDTCAKCKKKGHWARDCRSAPPQRLNATSGSPKGKDTSNTRHPDHGSMSWTACYTDDCYTHRGDKDGSGWYPRRPRQPKKKDTFQGYSSKK